MEVTAGAFAVLLLWLRVFICCHRKRMFARFGLGMGYKTMSKDTAANNLTKLNLMVRVSAGNAAFWLDALTRKVGTELAERQEQFVHCQGGHF